MTNHPNRNWLKKTPPSLVRSWLEMELLIPGRTRANALEDLNEEFSTGYTHSRLNEWLRGDREPERAVRNYMLRSVIQRVLAQNSAGVTLTDAQLDRIADHLS